MAEWEKQQDAEEGSGGMVGQVLNGGQAAGKPDEPKFQAFTGAGYSMAGQQVAD